MRLPFDGSFSMTASFQAHLSSANAAVKSNPGVDWSMPVGTPLYAVEPGITTQHTDQYGALWVKLVSNDGKREWRYVHLSKFGHLGQVDSSMHIGFSGNTGLTSGPHLHFGLKESGVWKDPMSLISANPATADEAAQLREILKVQRPDVIAAGVPVVSWWYANGVHELLAQLEKLGRKDVIDASRSVPDSGYWLMSWYIIAGSKEYPKPPYIWGAKPPEVEDPCASVKKELALTKAKYTEALNTTVELEKVITQLKTEIETLTMELFSAREQVDELQKEVDALKVQLAEAEAQRAKYQKLYQECLDTKKNCFTENCTTSELLKALVARIFGGKIS